MKGKLLGLVVVLVLSGCRDPDAELRRSAEDSRFRREALAELGAPLAGISARRRIDVVPMNVSRLRGDTTGYAFERYNHRCSACHAVPDPRLHSPRAWRGVLDRMNNLAHSAGLLPIEGAERDSIQAFLDRQAARR